MGGAHRIAAVAGDPPSLAGNGTGMPRALLVELADSRSGAGALPDALHRQWPRNPVGLVAGGAQQDTALQMLRERRADRLIPKGRFEAGAARDLEALYAHGARLDALHARLAPMPARTLFITGATGFLGGHFLRYLLRCGDARVIALTRGTRTTPFDRRLAHLQRLHPGRIQCVEGDVCAPGLGLSPRTADLVAAEADEVWHLAAITKFDAILRDAIFEVNLSGTRNVLATARRFPRLTCFHHVSTAYVAGNWTDGRPVPEAPLERPEDFKNPYEESKFLAEQAVAEAGLPVVVYRPSIILGERISGLCDGQTVYNVAKMLRLARLSGMRAASGKGPGSFRVVVDPAAAKNLIPVDDVVCRMLGIAAGGPAPGRYFNLAHPVATPMTDLIAVIASQLDIPEYEAVLSLEGERLSVSETVLQRISGVFRPYMLRSDPAFETAAGLQAAGPLAVPRVDRPLLHFLLGAFFEQHYGCDSEAGLAGA